jgi:hypothetical protein
MPVVRIDLRKGKDRAYRQEIGRVVYDALVDARRPSRRQITEPFGLIGCYPEPVACRSANGGDGSTLVLSRASRARIRRDDIPPRLT